MSDEPNEHYRLSPSSSAAWTTCTAQTGFVEEHDADLPPDTSGPDAIWGTQAHSYSQMILLSHLDRGPAFTLGMIPEEWRECVKDYTDRCIESISPHGSTYIEARVPLFYAPVGKGFGTCDFAHITPERVLIRDLKAGQGVSVDAEQNTQLAIYAQSLIEDLRRVEGKAFHAEMEVVMEIDQPRYRGEEPVRRWTTNVAELADFCEHIKTVQELIDSGAEGVFAPSEKACRWCRAKGICPSRQEAFSVVPGDVFSDLTVIPKDQLPRVARMDDEQILAVFKNADVIRSILSDVEDYVLERANMGKPVPGTKMVKGRQGNRKWVDTERVERFLSRNGIPKGDRCKSVLLGPAQIEALPTMKERLKADPKFLERFNDYISRAEGKNTIALEEDKRAAVTFDANIFDIIEEQPTVAIQEPDEDSIEFLIS